MWKGFFVRGVPGIAHEIFPLETGEHTVIYTLLAVSYSQVFRLAQTGCGGTRRSFLFLERRGGAIHGTSSRINLHSPSGGEGTDDTREL